jgi:hypothetical protein
VGLAGCGSGPESGGLAPTPPAPPSNNVVSVTVDAGPSGLAANTADVDTLFTSVTICSPGSTTMCQTIDHIQVDTGSYGLRIISSVLATTLTLPQETDAVSGQPVVECTQFADGYSWGPIKRADMQISSESAANIAVQVIGDPAYPVVPTDCSSSGSQEDTVSTFGANGILGIGPFVEDCGAVCAAQVVAGTYYICATGQANCQGTALGETQQVSNPVAFFAADNNGTIVELPAVAAAGQATVTGSLVFGIDTQSNNALGMATVLPTDDVGDIVVNYKNTSLPHSYIDSGSNAYYFADPSIATCPSSSSAPQFFCPPSNLNLSASLMGNGSGSTNVAFSIDNADNLLNANPTFSAFNNIGAPNPDAMSFDLGLPFFFGRNVYTAIAGRNTSGGLGPYFAY